MIKGIAHIGIAVSNLEKGKEFYEKLSSLKSSEAEHFGELKFSFLPLPGTHNRIPGINYTRGGHQ